MSTIALYDVVEATFQPRRQDDLQPKMVPYIGWRGFWEASFLIEAGVYSGEWAMTSDHFVWWVPSGDLQVHAVLTQERPV